MPIALISPDIVGVLLAAAGLLAWGRRRPVLAGVLLGLAVMARTYPVLLIVVLGLLAARSGRAREWLALVGTAVATIAVIAFPWLAANSAGVLSTYDGWRSAPAGYGSPWLIPGLWGPQINGHDLPGFLVHPLSPSTVTRLAAMGWIVALLAGAVLVLGAPRRPRVAQVALVVVGIVLLTGKSFPVQSSLWLLPLVALALPRWREHLIWFGAEAAYFVAVWLYAASATTPPGGCPGGATSGSWWSGCSSSRCSWRGPGGRPGGPNTTWSATRTRPRSARTGRPMARWPSGELPDELGYLDDPLGGPFDGAEDRLIVRLT